MACEAGGYYAMRKDGDIASIAHTHRGHEAVNLRYIKQLCTRFRVPCLFAEKKWIDGAIRLCCMKQHLV